MLVSKPLYNRGLTLKSNKQMSLYNERPENIQQN
jgi:hypothetical protein